MSCSGRTWLRTQKSGPQGKSLDRNHPESWSGGPEARTAWPRYQGCRGGAPQRPRMSSALTAFSWSLGFRNVEEMDLFGEEQRALSTHSPGHSTCSPASHLLSRGLTLPL